MSTKGKRDHLFISYATEDVELAEWLALKLTAEAYKVWCDRTHLLGGESYPRDIDHAIKERTFRLLALLSYASIDKPNPRKERTLALSIARERKIDFLIPLNVDGLSATQLDWMTSDLTFIPFHRSWAVGFRQLLKKLKSIAAPRAADNGRASVCDWMAVRAEPAIREEKLWANLLPVTHVPTVLHRFEFQERLILPKLAEHWAFYWPTNSRIAWAFGPPADNLGVQVRRTASVCWQDQPEFDGLRMEDLALAVLRKAITVRCLQRGMKTVRKSRLLYFPEGLVPDNHLRFTGYDGKGTYVNAVGERTFRWGEDRERLRYHLAPSFHLTSADCGQMALRISMHVHLTDLAGHPLEGSKVTSRRKRICRRWWNHEWVSRFMAVVQWLRDGQAEIEVLRTTSGSFRIAAEPIVLSACRGIDEASLKPGPRDIDAAEIDESADDGIGALDEYDDGNEDTDNE